MNELTGWQDHLLMQPHMQKCWTEKRAGSIQNATDLVMRISSWLEYYWKTAGTHMRCFATECRRLLQARAYIKHLVSSSAGDHAIRSARKKHYTSVEAHRTDLLKRAPQLRDDMLEVDYERPEAAAILLPSSFSAGDRHSKGLDAMASVEYDIRQGQAHDALRNLRSEISIRNWNIREKKAQIHGIGANTRAQNYLKTLSNNIQSAGDMYRRARTALIALGMSDNDPVLQPLLPKEQHGKSALKSKPGQLRHKEPWFWTIQRPEGLDVTQERDWERECEFGGI